MPPLFLLGPTASGKHEAALIVAGRLDAEIVSVDSMKVYRGMDVGAAKPSRDALARVPHHLVDICDPSDAYNAGRFVRDAQCAMEDISRRGRRVLFVGGTSLYYKAFMYGIFEGPAADPLLRQELVALGPRVLHGELSRVDPVAAGRIHPNDLKRLVRAVEVFRKTGTPISSRQTQFGGAKREGTVACVWRDRADLVERIERRTHRMVREGLVDEVRALSSREWSREGRGAVGYREVVDHLEGRCPLEDLPAAIARNTWQLARKQMMWFRSFADAKPVAASREDTAERLAARILEVLGC